MQHEHCFIIALQFSPLCEEMHKIDFFASISATYDFINFDILGRKYCIYLHLTLNNDLIIINSRCNMGTVLLSHINFCHYARKIEKSTFLLQFLLPTILLIFIFWGENIVYSFFKHQITI
jgi:hypothetical protein